MFEIGDKVWYHSASWNHMKPFAAIITNHGTQEHLPTLICRLEDMGDNLIPISWWGYLRQFESRACHLCGAATDTPGCPLCPDCAEKQEALEQDARDEQEQRRRPL